MKFFITRGLGAFEALASETGTVRLRRSVHDGRRLPRPADLCRASRRRGSHAVPARRPRRGRGERAAVRRRRPARSAGRRQSLSKKSEPATLCRSCVACLSLSACWRSRSRFACPIVAQAQPLKTWGEGRTEPQTEPPTDHDPSAVIRARRHHRLRDDRRPPPTSAPTSDGDDRPAEPSPGIVRGPVAWASATSLEGVEIRGNTSTLARVIQRFVPFHPGDTLDVDDKELQLTRFRLLGTGFFRDVQLSLRRGTKRGYVILQVDVVERNTIVVNDLWLGLSADAEPNGQRAPAHRVRRHRRLGDQPRRHRRRARRRDRARRSPARAAHALQRSGLPCARRGPPKRRSSTTTRRTSSATATCSSTIPTQTVAQDFAVVSYQRFGGLVGRRSRGGQRRDARLLRLPPRDDRRELPRAASHLRGLDVEPIDFYLSPGLEHALDGQRHARARHARRAVSSHARLARARPRGGARSRRSGAITRTPSSSFARLVGCRCRGITSYGSKESSAACSATRPLFEKFYVGDYTDLRPHRALDLAFDRRAAPNFLNTTIAEVRYGDYAARLNAEYRIPIYRGRKSIYGVDFFGSVGVYAVADGRDITSPARGYQRLLEGPGRPHVQPRPQGRHRGGRLLARHRELHRLHPDPIGGAVRRASSSSCCSSVLAALRHAARRPRAQAPPTPTESRAAARAAGDVRLGEAARRAPRCSCVASFSYVDVIDAACANKLSNGLPHVIVMRAYVLPRRRIGPGRARRAHVPHHVRPLGGGLPPEDLRPGRRARHGGAERRRRAPPVLRGAQAARHRSLAGRRRASRTSSASSSR